MVGLRIRVDRKGKPFKRLYEMLKLTLLILWMKTQMQMIMTITLHSWKIEIGLGIIKVKRMLVLAWVELSTKGRTFSIHIPLYKTRCVF